MTEAAAQSGEKLSSAKKAAVLMISLGPEKSAEVMRHLSEEEVERLTQEIASMPEVQPAVRERVLSEFQELLRAQQYIDKGGVEYARQILERALGNRRALAILQRLTSNVQERPFAFIRKADPSQLINYLQGEHPQTIALILSFLDSQLAAMILSSLPQERQVEVARRIALMDRTSPEVIQEVEQVLERKLSSLVTHDYARAGGIEAIVQILNNVDRSTERYIFETLSESDPELVEEIKKRMFVFEDVVTLDDRSVQRFLREIDLHHDLPLALKAASEEVREKIYRNISSRAVEIVREEMEFMGPVRLRDVEEAQHRIVAVIRQLDEEGEIVIGRGQGDEVIV